ncbi:MAG: hypothetical protein M3Q08_01070 [Pseudomonadota bacterium]|nr:hypothetical protein [Pseudomonadota bacterium]
MTLQPLGFDFPLMSGLSRRPPYKVEPDEYLLEIDAELERRRRAYPMFVQERRMKPEEAERHIAILLAIRADFKGTGTSSDIGWDAKIRELRRELALRRHTYPRQIGSRRLNEAEAAQRMERLEGVHWRYWILLDFCDELELRDCLEQQRRTRAYLWRVDQWERTAADLGDPAARPHASTAAREAWFALRPERREPASRIEALYLEAARYYGFAPPQEQAA